MIFSITIFEIFTNYQVHAYGLISLMGLLCELVLNLTYNIVLPFHGDFD